MELTDRERAIRERVDAATLGPWREGTQNVWSDDLLRCVANTERGRYRLGEHHCGQGDSEEQMQADARFIAAAREDIPWLLDQLAAARRLLFVTHPCDGKYGDDGEMQCNCCMIDFKRDPMEVIDGKIGAQRLQNAGQLAAARERNEALERAERANLPVLRCHRCNGAMVYKRISEGEIEVYHSCVPSPRLLRAVREGAVADELAKPVKRVIPGCAHSLDRMVVWAKEGACPICLTAELGIRARAALAAGEQL